MLMNTDNIKTGRRKSVFPITALIDVVGSESCVDGVDRGTALITLLTKGYNEARCVHRHRGERGVDTGRNIKSCFPIVN